MSRAVVDRPRAVEEVETDEPVADGASTVESAEQDAADDRQVDARCCGNSGRRARVAAAR